jgi:uncharacterized protein YjbJ (UPF0337 family)
VKPSTTNKAKGNLHLVTGKVKEQVGKVIKDPTLEAEGKDEKDAGHLEQKVGQVEKLLGE